MSWQHWVIVGLLVLAMFGVFVGVGKERKPRIAEEAFLGFLINAIVLMLLVWGQR